jgi:hypothetical protein
MSANWINKLFSGGLILFQTMVWAAFPVPAGANLFTELQADIVIDQELESMRGGFTFANGLEVTFGVEQAVFIDGILQVTSNFNTSPITSILPQQLANFSTTAMSADAITSQVNTVIQNSQDQRVIDNITQINAAVTILGLYRQLNVLDSLRQQQIHTRQ